MIALPRKFSAESPFTPAFGWSLGRQHAASQ